MKKRFKIPNKKSKRKFANGAKKTHKFNHNQGAARVMRGGIRL